MDNTVKRREWVKTAAIIFLAVLLALTFFSNTIMNRTLPEVSTVEVTDGTITAKVKGTGTVSARGNTEIKSNATTTVASVKIKEGQEVSEGDTLFILGEQSEELTAAETELSSLQYQLQRYQNSYPTGSSSSALYEAYQTAELAVTEAQTAYDEALYNYNHRPGSDEIAEAKNRRDIAKSNYETQLKLYKEEEKKADDEYQTALSDPTIEIERAKAAYEARIAAAKNILAPYEEKYDEASAELDALTSREPDLKNILVAAESKLNSAIIARDAALNAYNQSVDGNNQSITSTNIDIAETQAKITKLQAKINEYKGGDGSKGITAPVGGTISSVGATAGQSIAKGDVLCTIEVPDQGYQISFSVTNDQAKRLKVGDSATISNFYWGSEITATVSSIKTDAKNPQTNKTVVCDLEGDDITSGSQMTVAIGSKSASYDTIVPKSAVRTDSNGTYVLAIESKSSALGNRYYARRVDVEQLATDDVNVAVSGNLSYGDFVVTTSSEKISPNAQVRMADTE